MEKYTLDKDISLFYVTAVSFPAGVGGAFSKLSSLLPEDDHRILYGISRPEGNGGIVYRAAAEEAYPGEGAEKGCETFLVRKGTYLSEYLADWKKDETIVGRTFRKLLDQPGLDPNGYCLEIYPNHEDVRCLVPQL